MNKVVINEVETVSGSAGGSTNEAYVVLRVKGEAVLVEDVRSYVEQACAKHEALVEGLRNLRDHFADMRRLSGSTAGRYTAALDRADALLKEVQS